MEEIIISKEDAVFWMDSRGYWCNQHGRFRHPKVIAYFNRAIRRDDSGYYLTQIRDGIREKVYFSYDQTPLFAVDVDMEPKPTLTLNTQAQMELDPAGLFIADDTLFFRYGDSPDEIIKFTGRAMLKIADFLIETPEGMCLQYQGCRYPIENKET